MKLNPFFVKQYLILPTPTLGFVALGLALLIGALWEEPSPWGLAIALWPFGKRRVEEREPPILAWLVPVNPGAMGKYPVQQEICRIGRAEDNDVCINHDTVSAQHAQLRQRRDGFFAIEDLNSTNGTVVNGKVIKSRILRDNDLIEIGEVRLRLVIEKGAGLPSAT
ncbi:MAG: FHA domain-containing protein [Candidatus Competibacterales bacterium]